MSDNNDQFAKLRNKAEGKKSGLGQHIKYPDTHDIISALPPLTQPSDLESVYNNIELTMSHIIRDILMPINIHAPAGASLARQDYHALMSGMSVYPAAEEKIYRLSTRLPRVLLNYFLHESTYYSRVMIEHIELIIERKPQQDEAGQWYIELRLEDNSLLKLPVVSAVLVRGIGSDALREELFALFHLRQKLFRGLNNVAKHSHKVVVTVAGLTAMMAEASKERKVLDAVRNELNQQVLSIFDNQKEIALVDKNTEIGSFKMEVSQLAEQMDFVYSELARILQVPKTKLLGNAPGGLNATGEYDYRNYQDLLESVRTNVLYPYLEAMELSYSTTTTQDMMQVQQVVQTLVLAEQQLSGLRTEGMRELYVQLLGSGGLGVISDDNINIVPYQGGDDEDADR